MKLTNVFAITALISSVVCRHPIDPISGKFVDDEHLVKDSKNGDLDLDLNLDPLTGSIINELAEYENSQVNNHDESDNQLTEKNAVSPIYLSISMILVSEIGDKTFLIAAIMSMKYPRKLVFSAAASALVLMTALSGAIGHIFPTLISPKLTRIGAAILFFIFGVNLLRESFTVTSDQGVEEELAEVEQEISNVERDKVLDDVEKGTYLKDKEVKDSKMSNFFSLVTSPIWFQIFSMTFLAEWGDRSQITTIAMAAGADWLQIIIGASLGHMICTLLAVLSGQFISTKISLKTILLSGSIAFFIFSMLYCYAAVYSPV